MKQKPFSLYILNNIIHYKLDFFFGIDIKFFNMLQAFKVFLTEVIINDLPY